LNSDEGAEMTRIYAQGGGPALLNRLIEKQLKDTNSGAPHSAPAIFAIAVGHIDTAIQELQGCLKQRDFSLLYLRVDPAYDELRADPRFQELLHSVGLQ